MAYNSHGNRIRSENLAGQVTTTAWDQFACTSVDELISAAKNVKCAKHAYDFGDIGNRESLSERGTNATYAVNHLNQYTEISNSTVQPSTSNLQPLYDADGNQTLVKTATGIWQVEYNGENRPVRWTQGDTVITMSFDRMGRRVTKNDERFVYNDYLQITDSIGNAYVWDPTEPVATRPLAWNRNGESSFYTHDGNKNVSEVVSASGSIVAHYEYAPFGAVTSQTGSRASSNPYRFSSEFADVTLGLMYYNYRHYEPMMGRWLTRDPVEETGGLNLYLSCKNSTVLLCDFAGMIFKQELCLALRLHIQKHVDSLNHELEKYDPVLDGKGEFPYNHGKKKGVTKPGGHYEEIKNLQQAIKKKLKEWKDVCSDGPDSCHPIVYPVWADQLANKQIPRPVYNNNSTSTRQTVPAISEGSRFWKTVAFGVFAGAVVAVAVGNAGPLVVIPEEILTVPVSALVGGAMQGFYYFIH